PRSRGQGDLRGESQGEEQDNAGDRAGNAWGRHGASETGKTGCPGRTRSGRIHGFSPLRERPRRTPELGRPTAMMRIRFSTSLLLLLLLGSITPAFAELKEVRVVPAQPSRCDPVAITALGVLPDECHQIVRATIEGPLQVCVGDLCPEQFYVNITVRQPNPAATCLAVNVPYTRSFRVGTLPPGDYVIGARERVIPYYSPDSTDSIVSETFASLAFTVRADSTCVGTGCYHVSFHDPAPGEPRLGCDGTA